jgi:hypothetical protein
VTALHRIAKIGDTSESTVSPMFAKLLGDVKMLLSSGAGDEE